jgi:hypothetical protein
MSLESSLENHGDESMDICLEMIKEESDDSDSAVSVGTGDDLA